MKIINRLNFKFFNDSKKQDIFFLVGIFLFASLLILALLPDYNEKEISSRNFFVFTAMIVPVITAIYLITISFDRNYELKENVVFNSSIRKKMTISFIFVAILPSMIIVFASNNFFNRIFDKMVIPDDANIKLKEFSAFDDVYFKLKKRLEMESSSYLYLLKEKQIDFSNKDNLEIIRESYKLKKMNLYYFSLNLVSDREKLSSLDKKSDLFLSQSNQIFNIFNRKHNMKAKLFYFHDENYVFIPVFYKKYLTLFSYKIVDSEIKRLSLLNKLYENNENFADRLIGFKNDTGIYLLVLSIFIILISLMISLILSKNLTLPILSLSKASEQIAKGNLEIGTLHWNTNDEIANLYLSFNRMVIELKESRETMLEKQKLEAWHDMAKRVVHEIKNPLTPIRLSAERMQKRYFENHPDIDKIIKDGNDTIISEVEVLLNILKEFTDFARLPKIKQEFVDINGIIKSITNLFVGHEFIRFDLELEDNLPLMYVDKFLLKQVLTNLVQNSIDAMDDKGFIFIKTQIFEDKYNSCLKLIFFDNGNGVEQDEIKMLFEPGYTTKKNGTGLGLAIVKKIIVDHGGKIECNSSKKKGTEFIIDFPIKVKNV